jgi:hypothetical protein
MSPKILFMFLHSEALLYTFSNVMCPTADDSSNNTALSWVVLILLARFQIELTHQLLICAANCNLLDDNVCSRKETTEAFIIAGKESGLQVNAEKTYLCLVQNAGQYCNIEIGNKYFESVTLL